MKLSKSESDLYFIHLKNCIPGFSIQNNILLNLWVRVVIHKAFLVIEKLILNNCIQAFWYSKKFKTILLLKDVFSKYSV